MSHNCILRLPTPPHPSKSSQAVIWWWPARRCRACQYSVFSYVRAHPRWSAYGSEAFSDGFHINVLICEKRKPDGPLEKWWGWEVSAMHFFSFTRCAGFFSWCEAILGTIFLSSCGCMLFQFEYFLLDCFLLSLPPAVVLDCFCVREPIVNVFFYN